MFSGTQLRFIEPQLATLVDQPPEGQQWIHEIKYDGYRCQALLELGQVRVFTRNGHDWSDRYPSIVHAARGLRCRSAIIDGEAIIQDGNGASDFQALSSAIWSPRPANIILYAFDLMHLDGSDLRRQPLSVRRSILKHLIGRNEYSRIQFSDEFDGDGAGLFKVCMERGLEGIVSKLATATYCSGRTKTWLKCKCFTESIFVVIGTDRDRKSGAVRVLLAYPNSESYAGAAFVALSADARTEFLAEVNRLTLPGFKSPRRNDIKWCQPKLTVRVKHLAGSKTPRHATVRAFAP